MYDLAGRRALVTGGSAGLGSAVAALLAERGCRVAINYAANRTRAHAALAALAGTGHALVQGDVFSRAGVEAVVADTIRALSGIDVVFSNAGWTRFGAFGDLDSVDDDGWMKCYEANVMSHLWLMQATRQHLEAANGCFIISSSVAGLRPSGSSMAYSVSKAATIHLAKSLAKACAPAIRVNSVAPGVLLTDWSKGFSEEQKAAVVRTNALGRMTELDDAAQMVVNLMSNASMTGQTIEISAGFML